MEHAVLIRHILYIYMHTYIHTHIHAYIFVEPEAVIRIHLIHTKVEDYSAGIILLVAYALCTFF